MSESSDIQKLTNSLAELTAEMRVQRELIEEVKMSCHNMDAHIGFVERVWDVVRLPFLYLLAPGRVLGGILGDPRNEPQQLLA